MELAQRSASTALPAVPPHFQAGFQEEMHETQTCSPDSFLLVLRPGDHVQLRWGGVVPKVLTLSLSGHHGKSLPKSRIPWCTYRYLVSAIFTSCV